MALSTAGDCMVPSSPSRPPMRTREQEEEEECARVAALPSPPQTPEEAALATYQAAFGSAGPPTVFIDLTAGNGDDDEKGKADV